MLVRSSDHPYFLIGNCLTLEIAAIPNISDPLFSYVAPCQKACSNQSRPWQGWTSCVSFGRQFTLAKGVARGVLGCPWPPLLQAFFNQTTYNRSQKCHDDTLAIVTIWWVPSLWHSVTPLWKILATPPGLTLAKEVPIISAQNEQCIKRSM